MLVKVVLLMYVVKISNAVVIHSPEKYHKDLTKAYHHRPQAFGYKYEPYAYPKYEFEYSVSDKNTGDHKYHSEARDGDRVRGEYSLVESDGSLRKVQYHADDHNGFNAVVSKTVNKHGDHAISVTDHTRFFYPVGHSIKINHYFPREDNHYQEVGKSNDINSKPVYEEVNVTNDTKMLMNQSDDKLISEKHIQFEERVSDSTSVIEASTIQPIVVETVPMELVPAEQKAPVQLGPIEQKVPIQLVPTVIPNIKEQNEIVNAEAISSVEVAKNPDISLAKEITLENEENVSQKESNSDSEVASSFYTTKYYYFVQ